MFIEFIAAGVLLVTIAGFLLILDRRDQRHAAQVAELCQRVQAPETAVAAHLTASVDAEQVKYLPFDDDAAYVDYRNSLNG